MRILVVENLEPDQQSWWRQYLPPESEHCQVFTENIPERNLPSVIIPLLKLYFKLSKYDVVITHQDGYATFIFAFLNSFFRFRKHRHFINEFITREKSDSFYSRIKFMYLKFSLSSVGCIMCSSSKEIEYYKQTLNLKRTEYAFVPLATNPKFAEIESNVTGDYIVSSGRTGRDYGTLIEAVRDLNIRLILVCDPRNLGGINIPSNVEVKYNIPLNELIDLEAKARFIVLPLQDRMISVGQSVLIQCMVLGKAVIVTKNAATVDYIEDDVSGLFVKPGDVDDLRRVISELIYDPEKVARIGVRAKEVAKANYLISSKIARISRVIANGDKKLVQ